MPSRRLHLDDVPGALLAPALAAALQKRWAFELSAGALRAGRLDRSRALALVATPRDFRPADATLGKNLLAGRFLLGGATLDVGPGGDPWDRISPSRGFAAGLHRFDWAPNLLSCGEAGAREGLRLFLDWRRLFYRPNHFVWSADILERRLFNLACGARRMIGVASDAEAAVLINGLVHQARYLVGLSEGPARQVQRLTVAAVATAGLNGRGAEALKARFLAGLAKTMPEVVLPDGGLKTRSPQAGLELLLDLQTLDDILLQRGLETPQAISRAIDRLGAATRFFTLSDGRLAGFHGGEGSEPQKVRAAVNQEEGAAPPPHHAPHVGYHRLIGPVIQVLIDAAPPAEGPWSVTACAQPLAIEVACGPDRIFSNSGWSPEAMGLDAAGAAAARYTAAGSTAELGGRSAGRILGGFAGKVLGPRLIGAARTVDGARNENEAGAWLALSHDGWARRYGLIHERRLFIDARSDELRGEDVFFGLYEGGVPRAVAFAVRFHAHPDVQVSIARDGRSVLLRGASTRGWWFRNDAGTVELEPAACFRDGLARRSIQVVLRGLIASGAPTRVRWKLTPVDPTPPKAPILRTRVSVGVEVPLMAQPVDAAADLYAREPTPRPEGP
jgi:uncharacterized heparinase superfamily protein